MLTREALEAREARELAPYAMRSGESRGRVHPEPAPVYRTNYQRDRDRVIHSTAFRRLEYKTQVFVNHEGDHYRTRLTHTMEVAQIARSIARTLNCNEDLTEAVALAHDVGHTPFGHAGEDALRELMKDHGGFEHNRHGLRVVDVLEMQYPDFPGLNLTFEVREAIAKHSTRYDDPEAAEFEPHLQPTLEAQIVEVADSIAYDSHDIDDGLLSGILDESDLTSVPLVARAHARVVAVDPAALRSDEKCRRRQLVRHVINLIVTDLVESTQRRIDALGLKSPDDVRRAGERIICFSPEVAAEKARLEEYLMAAFYRHKRLLDMARSARRLMSEMFAEYIAHPEKLPADHRERASSAPTAHQVACDYIAGMTDRYAQHAHQTLLKK